MFQLFSPNDKVLNCNDMNHMYKYHQHLIIRSWNSQNSLFVKVCGPQRSGRALRLRRRESMRGAGPGFIGSHPRRAVQSVAEIITITCDVAE